MITHLKRILAICSLLILWTNLSAQKNQLWADSVLHSLRSNASSNYGYKIKCCDTLLYLFNKNADYCNWIKTLTYQSYYLANKGSYKDALYSLYLANKKYRQNACNNAMLLPEIYLAYGNLYISLKENSKAIYYLKKGLDSWKTEWSDKEILIDLYYTKAYLYSTLDSQLYYYQLAYQIALETHNVKFQELTLRNIGSAYAVSGQNELAKTYLKRTLNLALKRNAYTTLFYLYNNLAGLSSNNKLVSNYIDSAIYFATLSGDLQDLQMAYQNRALFYSNTGQYEKGYKQLWKSQELKDSLFNIDKINAFAEMEQKYESEKKANEIKLLQREKYIANLKASRNLGINFGLGGALVGFIFVALAFYSQNKKKQKLNTELSIEKKKSDDLLLNILPGEIAEELKQKGSAEAKLYDHVTVLFTDFIDFTGMSVKLNAKDLVAEIHHCFKEFDRIIMEQGLEKIKTIGDAYIAVCGLPAEDKYHARKVIKAAIAIKEFMITYKAERQTNDKPFFELRIGVNSGPLVAGIVGVKKFAYDIWGDTVNLAARMEQNSEAGKINISGPTYELIKDEFTCEYRGKIAAKNKGEIDMYFVG